MGAEPGAGGGGGYGREGALLRSYAGLVAAFNATFAGALWGATRAGHPLPERVSAGDVALLGAATFTRSRLLARDRVTSVVRAPFTEYQGAAGHGEVDERARGDGVRRAVGELLVCPYCVSQWVAGGFAVRLVVAPRATRLVAATFATVGAADTLQLAYRAAEDRLAG